MEKILRIVMNKKETATTMADASWIVEEGLSTWELIEPSDDENDEQDYSVDDDELDRYVFQSHPSSSDLSSAQSPPHDLADGREDRVDLVSIDGIGGKCVYAVQEACPDAESWLRNCLRVNNTEYNDGDCKELEREEDEDEKYDDYDLDDELVPKSVIDRFGRQRIRKLGGKRAFAKMNKAKRLPYAYNNRPGCVYGKHGLGLKHNLIN